MATEQTLEDLKQQRASTKGSLSRIKNLVESNASTLTSTELECRLGILESYFKQILVYQTKIEVLAPNDTSRAEIEDLYITAKTKILSLLGTGRRSSVADMTLSVSHPTSHLPKQRLPRFSGKYSDYKNFINSFNNLVENDSSLTKIEKFNYLLSCLTDQALGTVKAYQVTDENYPKALLSLKERYDNDCLIFLEYISQLVELPKVQKASSVSLRSLVDNISALFSSLLSIGSFENICNAIIIHIAISKVDPETQSKWDEQVDYKKLPEWKECATVLNKRCQFLEARDSKQNRSESVFKPASKHKQLLSNPRPQTSLAVSQRSCICCGDKNHSITSCKVFLELSIMDRYWKSKKLGLCLNCLGKGHHMSKCPSHFKCQTCKQPHHSLLHRTQPTEPVSNSDSQQQTSQSTSAAVLSVSALEKERVPETQVILATALVLVKDCTGGFQWGRVLLDSGSQVNFINEKFANSLGLRKERKNVDIVGIGITETRTKHQTQTTIRSRYNNFEVSLEFLVAPSITGYQPETALNISSWNLPLNLELADESFNKPAQIDLLLGAEAFFELLETGQVKLGEGLPSLQKTSLGWIISGRYKTQFDKMRKSCFVNAMETSVDRYLEKFWELEEIQGLQSRWSEEQTECENHFKNTVEILPSGRLMVQLPLKKDPACLGASYDIAFRRFLSLERRLSKNTSLKTQYVEFLKEYEALGHMSRVSNPNLEETHYYLPHQCVVRPDSVSTKLRVVFDASCRTSSQVSLNGILMVGPTIQDELLIILLRFRLYRYALTADIVKMYRQVLVHPSHRKLQFILWRENEKTPIQTYELNTITYGTSSAPFLAIRCLQYLADNNQERLSLGASCIRSDFYVDDMLTGADDLETLNRKRNEVVSILNSAGLELSKWNSNHLSLIQEDCKKDIKLTESNLTSTLGIAWNPSADEFSFSYKPNRMYTKYTKRSILSLSSSLFDPMGLLSPIIIRAKIILQQLWIDKLGWDASIPEAINTEWVQFMADLHSLQNLVVPRYVFLENKQSVEVHGFADASMKAYGCCIYLRSSDSCGSVNVKLLVAKSRVAPAKKKQLPRLELCAAHLLAKLWVKIQKVIDKNYSKVCFWTDSAIVLHWISTHSSKLNTFVGNRVAEIQDTTKEGIWKHVPTLENPADVVSRGCTVDELKDSIWFKGPAFLVLEEKNWPSTSGILPSLEEISLEKRKTVLSCLIEEQDYYLKIISRSSSYTKIVRIFAYVIRYLNLRLLKMPFPGEYLTTEELEYSLEIVVNVIQMKYFAKEIEAIKSKSKIKGSIQWLIPFIHNRNGLLLLKVGGRLKHSNLPEESKHPLLLPNDCEFTVNFIRHLHVSNYHAGPKALVALSREKFWIINVRQLARRIVRKCPHCARYRPKLFEQVMGDLPAERLTSSRPFLCCGVDFCGPIYTYYKIRGKVPYKTYVAVFVCFSSKAVHLEAVSDLSADAFIGALRRMIGRRGLPRDIHCDNATNFVGAQTKLRELRDMLFKKDNHENIINFCTNASINFHFIPPRAPHFGGIWEAAVKVAKGHLYRSLGSAKLSFEELSTALVDIEAIMNSRPITSLSTDPNDFEALTPAHLLIGSSLKAIPESAVEVSNISYLQRWRRINAVKTHFWKRWSHEYVQELQGRAKWTTSKPNIAIGSLVIIHEDNLPPQRWLMGRVTKTIEGPDGRVRVADVKTSRGEFRRPIRKLAAIPS